MLVLMVAFGGLGYWYYQDTQEKMRIYAENQAKLGILIGSLIAALLGFIYLKLILSKEK